MIVQQEKIASMQRFLDGDSAEVRTCLILSYGLFQDADEFLFFVFHLLGEVVSRFDDTMLATLSGMDLCESLFNLSSVDVKTTSTCLSCSGQSLQHEAFRTLHLGMSSLDEEKVRLNFIFSHES